MAKGDRTVRIRVCELIEDLAIYPRHTIDGGNVADLADKIEAGVKLDPVIVDAKSKRITDGWHRVRAYRRVVGDDAEIEVILRHYEDEAEMIADGAVMNARHGLKLQATDMRRVVAMLDRLGVKDRDIALRLRIPEHRVIKLRPKVTTSPVVVKTCLPGTRKIVLKRPLRHLEGQKITEDQARANDGAPGTSYRLLIKQLVDLLRAGAVNTEDEPLQRDLRTLKAVLEEFGY